MLVSGVVLYQSDRTRPTQSIDLSQQSNNRSRLAIMGTFPKKVVTISRDNLEPTPAANHLQKCLIPGHAWYRILF